MFNKGIIKSIDERCGVFMLMANQNETEHRKIYDENGNEVKDVTPLIRRRLEDDDPFGTINGDSLPDDEEDDDID